MYTICMQLHEVVHAMHPKKKNNNPRRRKENSNKIKKKKRKIYNIINIEYKILVEECAC